MKLILTVALTTLLALSAIGPAAANSTAYYDCYNHYSSNCDTPSGAC
ncbi:hypothetical protein [Methylocystis parvus]|nr:hypothetical protein [Methylocystis parvus]WBK00121.1 hypothetical protein MMG94_19480 [Methylocystis parvus OBBP]